MAGDVRIPPNFVGIQATASCCCLQPAAQTAHSCRSGLSRLFLSFCNFALVFRGQASDQAHLVLAFFFGVQSPSAGHAIRVAHWVSNCCGTAGHRQGGSALSSSDTSIREVCA